MKILLLTNLYPPHHAGTYDFRCQTVTDRLRKRGHEVRVLTSNHGISTEQRDPEVERRLLLQGVFGHPPVAGLREIRRFERHNHQVWRESVTEYPPDLVYAWSLEGLPKSFVFGLRQLRRPVVYDVADYWLARGVREDPWLGWWNRPKAPFLHRVLRAGLEIAGYRTHWDAAIPTRTTKVCRRMPEVFAEHPTQAGLPSGAGNPFVFDRIYFCSRTLKQFTAQSNFRVDHAEVIYPGITTQAFFGEIKSPAAPVQKFLIVSPLHPASGVMTAIEAIRHARTCSVRASLSVYGSGESDYIAKLRSFVVQNQLPIEFLPVANMGQDLPAIYRRHDAFIYTAEQDEFFLQRPLEAMACGLPVIAAQTECACEILHHAENSFGYTPGNALDLLARIQELQQQPKLRLAMAETAQAEVCSQFSETNAIDKTEDYLETSRQLWLTSENSLSPGSAA